MTRIPLIIIILLLCATTVCAQEVTVKLNVRKTWIETPMGKPVIDRGSEGSWDFTAVDNPYVFIENNRYYCFFEAQDTKESNWHERIGLAISEDGVHWKKQANNPIVGGSNPSGPTFVSLGSRSPATFFVLPDCCSKIIHSLPNDLHVDRTGTIMNASNQTFNLE